MAFITYPLNNIDYTAEDAELFHCTRTSGIWAEDSFPISVTGADNNITIGKGIAWINNEEFSGKVTALKSAEVLDLGIADSIYPRIDVIAIQFNANNNETDVIVKNGTPATNPVRPAIVRTGAVYELYLASIYRPAGATAITASNITDLRMDKTVCGLMADSVTKVDMTAIEAQIRAFINNLQNEIDEVKNLSGLMFETEWTEGGVIPVSKGGTEAVTADGARQNINFIGTNPIATIEDDTVSTWAKLGTGVAFINVAGLITNQPNLYGWIENYSNGAQVYQVWRMHGGNAETYVRTGTGSGWATSWIKILTENNGIQIKSLWTNASPSSSFAAQTISLNLSGYKYVLVRYLYSKDYPSQDQIAVVKVGRAAYLTFTGAASTSSGNILLSQRTISVGSASTAFGAPLYKNYSSTANPTADNKYCIPVEIIGIKGVQ